MKKLAGGVLALIVALGALAALGRSFSYRAPLAGPGPRAPRTVALAELRERRAAKAEEERARRALLRSLDTEKMVALGKEIVHGRGLCFNCHRIGPEGNGRQGPDLAGVGERAGKRVPGMSDVDYLAQSLYEPRAFVVEGFAPAMTAVDRPPIDLSELDALMVIAYLQSLGGTATVEPGTDLGY